MFLDSDDTLPEDSLEILINEIRNSKSDIVVGSHKQIWKNSNKEKLEMQKHIGTYTPNKIYEFLLKNELTHNLAFGIFSSKLFNKDYFTIENQTNGEDLILFYQLVNESKSITIINNIIYIYFRHFESSTKQPLSIEKISQFIKAQNFKLQFLENVGISTKLILQNIDCNVARWYYKTEFQDVRDNLAPKIKQSMKMMKSIKYLTLKKWVKYVLLKR